MLELSFKVTFKAVRGVGVTDLSPAIANTLATPTVWWYVCLVRKSRSQLSSTPHSPHSDTTTVVENDKKSFITILPLPFEC